MHTKTLVATTVFALLAACGEKPSDTGSDRAAASGRAGSSSAASGGASQAQPSATPNTPANLGQPSSQEKREGANPQQGQVDPKERAQHRDFQQRGDSKGPSSAETQLKSGG